MDWCHFFGFNSNYHSAAKNNIRFRLLCRKSVTHSKKRRNKINWREFIFQQDGAKPQTKEAVKKLGFSIIAPEKWLSKSPDLNPLDYFFWNEVEVHLKTKNFKY